MTALRLSITAFAIGLPCAAQPVSIWKPAPTTSWQWQLSGPVDLSVEAAVYDIDLFDNDASVVAGLHSAGRRVICYLSAGTFEPWRPDASRFPNEVKGRPLTEFEEESWLDIRRLDVIGPVMEARLDLCKAKGFDAVEPDNVDGYQNDTGFPLTPEDQLRYNRFLADQAHARGLSIGLKNDLGQVQELLNDFDWALNEQCVQFNECGLLRPFVEAGKAVFHVEYRGNAEKVCRKTNALGFNSMMKRPDLDATRRPCRTYSPGPSLGAVVHGASGEVWAVAPGEIVSIYGRFMGPEQLSVAGFDDNGRLPAELDKTRVLIDGIPARLLYVQARQIGAIAPYKVETKNRIDVQVVSDSLKSDILSLKVAPVAPGIFTTNWHGQAAMLNEDGSLNTASNPALSGSVTVFYATGEGAREPGSIDGQRAVLPYPVPRLTAAVFIGGKQAPVLYTGAAPGLTGMLQLNVRVPLDAPSGAAVPVALQVGDAMSQPGVTMAVAPTP